MQFNAVMVLRLSYLFANFSLSSFTQIRFISGVSVIDLPNIHCLNSLSSMKCAHSLHKITNLISEHFGCMFSKSRNLSCSIGLKLAIRFLFVASLHFLAGLKSKMSFFTGLLLSSGSCKKGVVYLRVRRRRIWHCGVFHATSLPSFK